MTWTSSMYIQLWYLCFHVIQEGKALNGFSEGSGGS